MTLFAIGTRVTVTWLGHAVTGVVEDVITFNGRTRYGVRCDDGKLRDVWPDMKPTILAL